MTKAELVSAISEKAGLEKKDAQKALEAFVGCVTSAMKTGEDVRIVGFGNFVSVDRAAGMARNPRTGAQVARPASRAVKFRPGEGLKAAIQK
ncbi:HU family DNA-binding protein [soil metagenome]